MSWHRGSPQRPSTRARGTAAERRAAQHYRLRGYRVLARNVWAGGHELDLILRRGERVVFCEVKSKAAAGFGDPLEMVDEEKQRRLRRAAETWLAGNRELAGLEVCFDVVSVGPAKVERVSNAF